MTKALKTIRFGPHLREGQPVRGYNKLMLSNIDMYSSPKKKTPENRI